MSRLGRSLVSSLVVSLSLAVGIAAEPPRDESSDVHTLQQREGDLARKIAELEQELLQVRRALAKATPRRGVTPLTAVERFQRFPKEPVTVEFGVEQVGDTSGLIRQGDDPEPAIVAKWDNYLVGGGTMMAVIAPKAYRQLSLPTLQGDKVALTPGQERREVVKHIQEHGIRVTGVLEPTGINGDQYVIRVDEPENVMLYIKGSGQ